MNEGGHICGHICGMAYMWKSGDSSVEFSVLSVCMQVGSRDGTQLLGLAQQAEPPHWPQLDFNESNDTQLSTKKTGNCGLCRKETHLV